MPKFTEVHPQQTAKCFWHSRSSKKGQCFTCINFLSEDGKLIFGADNECWKRSAMGRYTGPVYPLYEQRQNFRYLPPVFLRWHYLEEFTSYCSAFWRVLQDYLTVMTLGLLRKEITTLNTKANTFHMPWDILENTSKNYKLWANFLHICKIISITGIQNRDVWRGFVYMLPTKAYLHSFRWNKTSRWRHLGP